MSHSPRYLAPHLRASPEKAHSAVALGSAASPTNNNRMTSATSFYKPSRVQGHVPVLGADPWEGFPDVNEGEFELAMNKTERDVINTFVMEIKKIIEVHQVPVVGVKGCVLAFKDNFTAQNTFRSVAVRMVAAHLAAFNNNQAEKVPLGKRILESLRKAGRKVQARLSGTGDD